MAIPNVDNRSPTSRARDEQIAGEPPLTPPQLPPDAPFGPVESYLRRRQHRPVAIAGIVENGLVRPLDPAVKLTEHSHVVIVAAEAT